MKPNVIAVVGPTASGKTDFAISLALKINGEIVSADSRLVYKGFNIAAAKPTPEEQKGIPHHLIDIVEPDYDYSVAHFCTDARNAIYDILSRNKVPIIVGGTGLYFRVLLEEYNLPEVKTDYSLREELSQKDVPELLQELKILDEITYERVKNANKRRIVRALEIIKTLNKPISEIQITKEPEFNVQWIMPKINSREELYKRINSRVDLMVEQGIVDETKLLLKHYGRIKNIVDTIGYREIILYLDGQYTFDKAIDKLKQHTRNYAKRQLTWFRRNPHLPLCNNL